MKNIEKVKKLEQERDGLRHILGALRKAVRDRDAKIQELEGQIEGAMQLNGIVDSILAVLAIAYGERDDEGWELHVRRFVPNEILDQYKVHAERNGADYVVQVKERG